MQVAEFVVQLVFWGLFIGTIWGQLHLSRVQRDIDKKELEININSQSIREVEIYWNIYRNYSALLSGPDELTPEQVLNLTADREKARYHAIDKSLDFMEKDIGPKSR